MPEISRFFGIVVRMFAEPGGPHHRPHFHAWYQEHSVVIVVDRIEVLGGDMPRRQLRLIEAWAEIHREELLDDWTRLAAGRPPFKIDPLR